MTKTITSLLTAKILSVALVIEVGFVIGLFVGKAETLNPLQWAGAGLALFGASMMAAMIHAWAEPKPKKANLKAWARD